ncbi:MAG: efflux RND transporter periplasmic adaptor subunit [Verrucomicrobiales bacterium]|nr:efflux RND transporter periplasmic adaptor subunit [Verrucomicrobiales bacterium]
MKKILPLILALVAGVVIGALLFRGGGHDHAADGGDNNPASTAAETWTCSMHPQVQAPKPGLCPICAMALIPLSELGGGGEGRVYSMSPASKILAGISTTKVVRRFPEAEIRLYGTVAYDETKQEMISARFPGRMDKLFVDYNGIRVKEGDHLGKIYSPELLAAQSELLSAKRFNNSDSLRIARDKLRLWGFPVSRINEIEASGKISDRLMIDAPATGIVTHKNVKEGEYVQTGMSLFTINTLDQLWVLFDAYESDKPWLRFGQKISFTAEAIPGKVFEGQISFIAPELDPKTRTVKVRVNFENPDEMLKPGMFVRGIVSAKVAGSGRVIDPSLAGKWISPMHPEVVKDGPGQCDVCGMDLVPAEKLGYTVVGSEGDGPLVIPVSAVLNTGKRSVVYVEKPDTEEPTYEGREILLGSRAGDVYLVEAGLKNGEEVVSEGAFAIDSALQIQARPSMMSPGDEGGRLFPREEVPYNFLTWIDGILKSYFAMQDGLAKDSLEEAQDAVEEMEKNIARLSTDTLSPKTKDVWTEMKDRLSTTLLSLKTREEIEPFRANFQDLTLLTDEMVRRFGTAHLPVYSHYCPMALDDKGASWLQPDKNLLNPYFGASMLQCGELSEQVAKAKAIPLDEKATGEVNAVLDAYFSLQAALAGDSVEGAKQASIQMKKQADSFPEMAENNPMAAFPMKNLGRILSSTTSAIAASDSIAVQRVSFKTVSEFVEDFITLFGGDLERTVVKAHCPMAFNDAGANWLQTGTEILNPYFGAEMLRCGEITDQLSGAPVLTPKKDKASSTPSADTEKPAVHQH